MIKNVVITAAGLGTRMLPETKETLKGMLPIFASGRNGDLYVKPLLQAVFEQLFDCGLRKFFFIVGEKNESVIKHFAYDGSFFDVLTAKSRWNMVEELSNFYKKLVSSSIYFVNQIVPLGFGDAVLRAEPYINESFIVHAGDAYILSESNLHLIKLITTHRKFKSTVTFLVKEVKDPKAFGIIEGEEIEKDIYHVDRVVEKPMEASTNLAITGLYIFNPLIFKALKSTPRGLGGELQLTDGIQMLIDSGREGIAVKLDKYEHWLDIGTPKSYWMALNQSRMFARTQKAYQEQPVRAAHIKSISR